MRALLMISCNSSNCIPPSDSRYAQSMYSALIRVSSMCRPNINRQPDSKFHNCITSERSRLLSLDFKTINLFVGYCRWYEQTRTVCNTFSVCSSRSWRSYPTHQHLTALFRIPTLSHIAQQSAKGGNFALANAEAI